ncbi:hypothetical protein LLB_1409 [Legionella longbeachae D-4968]|nr:hypothetical protein LLB_1409 [Legionella longbeachae D-4968]
MNNKLRILPILSFFLTTNIAKSDFDAFYLERYIKHKEHVVSKIDSIERGA